MSWILSHWSEILEALGALIAAASLVVGLLPESAGKSKAVAFLSWLSAVTFRTAPGTFKAPFSPQPKPPVATAVPVGARETIVPPEPK